MSEAKTGITLIKMNEKMDAGNVMYQEHVAINQEDNMITLSERLSRRVAEILPEIIDYISIEGMMEGIEQKHEYATYTPIIIKEMGKIDWHKSAIEIMRQVRAFILWPTAYTFLDNLMLKVFDAELEGTKEKKESGVILDINKDGILVSTAAGILVIKEVQLENRKRMKAFQFAQGYRNLMGKTLE